MLTATYDPADNKLRLRSTSRLDPDLYARVRAAGFIWAPKQDLFVAPMYLLVLTGELRTGELATTDATVAARWIADALGSMVPGDYLAILVNGVDVGARLAARLMCAANIGEIEHGLRTIETRRAA